MEFWVIKIAQRHLCGTPHIKLVRYEAVIDEAIREASGSSILRPPDLIPSPFGPGNCDRDPEVSEYEVTFVIDEKVFWLDIPMDNVCCLR